ncbi:gliding motility-associated C-terminal domain-containing protein [Fluviicola taffensis]|uniref:T9SS type B sorting domain-containing protein n=1 Tax=Fluviicola taffensis TaxID=191579 RepID=UPI003137F51A
MNASGQNALFFSNADTVFIDENAQVHVFGNMVISGNTSSLIQNGFVQTYNDAAPGNFEIQLNGNVYSKGNYRIEQDWINNGHLVIDTGEVVMYGGNQWFSGDSISRFYDLQLTGTGVKEQAQDIRVRNQLDLTNRELAVHQKRVYIDNASDSSIVFDSTFGAEGIISTDEDGQIRKVIHQNELNLIPTGSLVSGFRHRPLVATLLNVSSDTLVLTYHQHSPDLIGLLSTDLDSLCRIQTAYFYTIHSTESSAHYDLGFSTYLPTDGNYPDPSYWDNPTWKPIPNRYAVSGTNYTIIHAADESDFTQEHYSLGHRTPVKPEILIDTTECYTLSQASVIDPDNMSNYDWSVWNTALDAEIASGQGSSEVTIDWNSQIGGTVAVSYQDADACWSFPTEVSISDVSIQADFTSNHANSVNFDTDFTFTNTSSGNIDQYTWVMPTESIDMTTKDPLQYTFTTDGNEITYPVWLIASDSIYGCIDTAYQEIIIPNIFVIYAPNSFTPNGDGINDFFLIEASDILSLDLSIFNRWGELIYHGEAGAESKDASWDGKYQGELVQDGTYTYLAKVVPKNYNQGEYGAKEISGSVLVLR